MRTPSSPREPSISAPPSRRAEVKPLAPERYKIQFTVDREAHDKLRRAQDLLRHTIPDGDLAAIFDKAITLLLEDLARAKHGAAGRPRSVASTGRNGGGLTAHTCCDAARGVATRWRAVRLCRQPGPVHGDRASSSSIISSRMPWEAKPRSRISNYGAARTTRTRLSGTSALAGRGFRPTNREAPRGDL